MTSFKLKSHFRILVAFFIALAFTSPLLAQTTINGTVSNANGEGLVGAYITVPAITGIGAITDEKGAFSLKRKYAACYYQGFIFRLCGQ